MAYKRRSATLERPAEINLLAAPVRQDIVDTLEALGGNASVAELADRMGRPADGLYYHLRLLVQGGLLEETGRDRARRYRTTTRGGQRLRLRYKPGRNANAAAVGSVTASMLRTTARDFSAAIADDDVVAGGRRRELWAARVKGWVGPKELAEVNELLTRLLELLKEPRDASRPQLVALTWVLAPLAAKPTRRDDGRDGRGPRRRARPKA